MSICLSSGFKQGKNRNGETATHATVLLTVPRMRQDYLQAIQGIKDLLVRRTVPNNLLFVGELHGHHSKTFSPKMDHLVCYLPGTLALGVRYGMPADHLDLAQELLYTCYRTYSAHPTHLAPEITYFNTRDVKSADMYVMPNDVHCLLRPETVESLWYLYHLTGNATYQEWGWNIFQAFLKHAKVEHGFSSVENVLQVDSKHLDKMESFFLGETLKYLYLLFAEDQSELSLDQWIFNSEAHPLPMYSS